MLIPKKEESGALNTDMLPVKIFRCLPVPKATKYFSVIRGDHYPQISEAVKDDHLLKISRLRSQHCLLCLNNSQQRAWCHISAQSTHSAVFQTSCCSRTEHDFQGEFLLFQFNG